MTQLRYTTDDAQVAVLKPSRGITAGEVKRVISVIADRVARCEADRRTLGKLHNSFLGRAIAHAKRVHVEQPEIVHEALLGEVESFLELAMVKTVGLIRPGSEL